MKKECSLCGRAESLIEVSRIGTDGKPATILVCADCARQHGLLPANTEPTSPEKVVAKLGEEILPTDAELVCPGCQQSYADFKRKGRAGCAQCYTTFGERLKPLVRRIHGAVQHIGRTPSPGPKPAQDQAQIERLRRELQAAIEQEDYERAAGIRDRLAQCGNEPTNT